MAPRSPGALYELYLASARSPPPPPPPPQPAAAIARRSHTLESEDASAKSPLLRRISAPEARLPNLAPQCPPSSMGMLPSATESKSLPRRRQPSGVAGGGVSSAQLVAFGRPHRNGARGGGERERSSRCC
uniref:Uncharacterized protein n=1 Tax=Arundo donax TaxID=35708 RepID=A0A0A9GS71_ARUDO